MVVLGAVFQQLSEVGVPFPVCYHLQDMNLHLRSAQWMAKQSQGGFSVSFFWPACATKQVDEAGSSKKAIFRSRKKRRRMKKAAKATVSDVTTPNSVQSEVLVASPI